MPKYTCERCFKDFSQKSHYDKHQHKKLSCQDNSSKIEEIVENFIITKKLISANPENIMLNNMPASKANTSIPEPTKIPEDVVVWQLGTATGSDAQYQTEKAKIDTLVKSCHQHLYNNGSIIGVKAINDIMRLLPLKLLQSELRKEDSPIWNRANEIKAQFNLSDQKFTKFRNYILDLNNFIPKKDELSLSSEWKSFVDKFLMELLPDLFNSEDNTFNCSENALKGLISKISGLECDSDAFRESYQTSCGDIHESFLAYGGSKSAKELGQFFTPRKLIHLIFHAIGLSPIFDGIGDGNIYDPCCGTGGFLTRLYQHLSYISPTNIYGCETEADTIKFAIMSIALTTKQLDNNIYKCDSLCQNPLLLNGTKMKMIVTNPPFGTSMTYTGNKTVTMGLLEKFVEYAKNETGDIEKDWISEFKSIYPIKTNNGPCLFVQHCVHMLAENGVCVIVLPGGGYSELPGKGKNSVEKRFRKWWCTTVNIRTIVKVQPKTFDHTAIGTYVVVFTKDGPTQEINYLQITDKHCREVKTMFKVSKDELKAMNYELAVGSYLKDTSNQAYGCPMVELGEVCEFKGYQSLRKKDFIEGDYPVIGGGRKPAGFHNTFNRDENTILCSATGSYAGYISKYANKVWCSESFSIHPVNGKIINNYLYYYLKTKQERIYEMRPSSGGQPHMYDRLIKKLKIPLPSLEIQQQIVDELDSLQTKMDTIRLRLDQLSEEKQAYEKYGKTGEIREMLGVCDMVELGEVCEINTNNITKDDKYNTIKYLDLSSVKNGKITKLQELQFKISQVEQREKYY